MTQWFLRKTVKLAQYGQGIGRVHADEAALRRLQATHGPLIIFDVGANIGNYSQLALSRLKNRQISIHAFEPGSVAFEKLQQRFGRHRGIALNQCALGSERGVQTLYYDTGGSELSSLYPRKMDHHGLAFSGSETVRVEKLDDYCELHDIRHIDLLKLDAEGHELRILEGAIQMFESASIDMVSFEFGGCNIDSRTFVRDFFDFFARYALQLARVSAFGKLHVIRRYEESLEQFRTTCFVALKG